MQVWSSFLVTNSEFSITSSVNFYFLFNEGKRVVHGFLTVFVLTRFRLLSEFYTFVKLL